MKFLTETFRYLCRTSPNIKRSLWRQWYQYLATKNWGDELLFMNYGFASLDSELGEIHLNEDEEKYRLRIQLYHYVADSVEIKGKNILEVGCGRGGGSAYLARHLKPKSLIGVDFSQKAINFCREHHSCPGLSFQHGDAESLPFEDSSFDVLINVESSYCYGHMDRFLTEVRRVLIPGGYFTYADFRGMEDIESLRTYLNNSSLKLIDKKDITPNVLKAMELGHDTKIQSIQEKAPRMLKKSFISFTGTKDSTVYNGFSRGEKEYFRYVFQKPAE